MLNLIIIILIYQSKTGPIYKDNNYELKIYDSTYLYNSKNDIIIYAIKYFIKQIVESLKRIKTNINYCLEISSEKFGV